MTDATLAAPQALARVYGEPMLHLPQDLYIPPDALEVILDAFEGPLDLLLYLIRKHNLDILDIPMAELTRQYMAYVELLRHTQLELAAEYLVMAAMLTEIKSRMLLPRPAKLEEASEEDPRAQLVRRLLEYEQMKYAAHQLDTQPQVGRDIALVQVYLERVVAERISQVSIPDLQSAWEAVLLRAKNTRHHRVSRHELSVREHMTRVLRSLSHGRFVEFIDLFSPQAGVAELIVTFLAVLELAKERLIEFTQQEVYAPIYVKRLESEEHGR